MQFVDHSEFHNHARCASCGYDIHGLMSDECPECGATNWLALASFDQKREFVAAVAVLCAQDIEHQSKLQSSNAGAFSEIMGFQQPGMGTALVFVKRSDLKRAVTAVESMDDQPALPIVDRAEPVCPGCAAALDPLGRSICLKCALKFDWVDIDPAEFEAE